MPNPAWFTILSALFTIFCTALSLLVTHVTVTTRHATRLEQLEKESAEFKAQFRAMPLEYVPRNEVSVHLEFIQETLTEMKAETKASREENKTSMAQTHALLREFANWRSHQGS